MLQVSGLHLRSVREQRGRISHPRVKLFQFAVADARGQRDRREVFQLLIQHQGGLHVENISVGLVALPGEGIEVQWSLYFLSPCLAEIAKGRI
ncbi:hypothetical protein PS723_06584 [Pseudomonas fluorescens]|uniref:Uncharacterized protein n=1 Tax=Pseudomonas fluorescens TaxID=294 RepID=A0A5E7G147_PSEFL|nr:hypothetical protein PS723_06584 [Pseudomonas fluorescens]